MKTLVETGQGSSDTNLVWQCVCQWNMKHMIAYQLPQLYDMYSGVYCAVPKPHTGFVNDDHDDDDDDDDW